MFLLIHSDTVVCKNKPQKISSHKTSYSMPFKGAGYFVNGHAKAGFVGGIGGQKDTTEKEELYNRIVGLLKIGESSAIPAAVKVTKEEGLDEKWKTACMNKQNIDPRWSGHRGWWTLNEIDQELTHIEEVSNLTNEIIEDSVSIGLDESLNDSFIADHNYNIISKEVSASTGISNGEMESSPVSIEGATRTVRLEQWKKIDNPKQMGAQTKINPSGMAASSSSSNNPNIMGESSPSLPNANPIIMGDKTDQEEISCSQANKIMDEVDVCNGCNKGESEHYKDNIWLICNTCNRYFIKECGGANTDKDSWKCPFCIETNRKMEDIVEQWPILLQDIAEMKRNLVETNRKAKPLERDLLQATTIIEGQNDTIKKLEERLEEKINAKRPSQARGERTIHESEVSAENNELKTRLKQYEKDEETYKRQILQLQRKLIQVKGQNPTKEVFSNIAKADSQPSSRVNKDHRVEHKSSKETRSVDTGKEKNQHWKETDSTCRKRKDDTHTNWQNYRILIPQEELLSGPRESKKRKHTPRAQDIGRKLVFFGDSLIKNMVEDKGLQVTSLEEKWEVCLKRGGMVKDIRRMVTEKYNSLLQPHTTVVVSAGTNDISRIQQAKREDEQLLIDSMLRNMGEIIKECNDRRCNLLLLIPGPRNDVTEVTFDIYTKKLMELAENHKVHYRTMKDTNETYRDFITNHLRSDGIHVSKDKYRSILQIIGNHLGLNFKLHSQDKDLDRKILFPNCCWYCGGYHGKTGECNQITGCHRCGEHSHNEEVCLSVALMCTSCGQRGHKRALCQQ